MDNQNGTGKTPESAIPKPTFHNLYNFYHLDYDDLQLIASNAGVTKQVVTKMFLGDPVKRSDAIAVIAAFSQMVVSEWTIDMMTVPVLPEPESETEP
jgi:hypothetical protein